MSLSEEIKLYIARQRRGQIFSNERLLALGQRSAVDKAISRLVAKRQIQRILPGLYVKPKQSKYVKNYVPDMNSVVRAIAQKNQEVIQVHGAEAARIYQLSTQIPLRSIYYTSGPTRKLQILNRTIEFKHASRRVLQEAGKPAGVALSALLFLGKTDVSLDVIRKIQGKLSQNEFQKLKRLEKPEWLNRKFREIEDHPTNV